MNEKIKDKLRRGLALTVNESWNLYKYIEALEQQPYRKSEKVVAELKLDKKFIDEAVQEAVKDIKPNYIPKDVLDKIRAEIDNARFIDKDTRICKNALASGLEVAMQIIDKYRTESNKEGEE